MLGLFAQARTRHEIHVTVIRAGTGERIPLGRVDGWHGYVNKRWWSYRWQCFRDWLAGRRERWR